MKTIAVFFGGKSNEREISVITGTYCINLLKGAGYNVVPVYLSEDNLFYSNAEMTSVTYFCNYIPQVKHAVSLAAGKLVCMRKPKKVIATIDCALNCCHGGMGEDGTLSALLRYHNIKSASPDTAVSAMFMDKSLSKLAVSGLDIPVLPSVTLREGEETTKATELDFPVIVKPARLGSSIGIKIANNREELAKALEYAYRLDDTVIVERYLNGKRDVNCAAYRKGGDVVLSACEEVFSDSDILTFAEKYEGKGERRSAMPADLDERIVLKIQTYLRKIYDAFHVRGVVRADFLVLGKEVYFNELNTVPGSLATYLFAEKLTLARDFVASLVEDAMKEQNAEKQIVSSGILNSNVFFGAKSCKRR